MKRLNALIVASALTCSWSACEKKQAPDAEAQTAQTEGAPTHIDTNREAFKAAGAAKEQIEGKQVERNSAVDEAMKAGE